MQPGRLKDRVTVVRPSVVNDGGAVTSGTPTTVASRVHADVQSATASRSERLFGTQVSEVTSYVVTMRSGLDVQMQDQLVWHVSPTSNTTLEVVGIALQGPRRDTTVVLAEVRSGR